jgi:hypothetical protein
MAVRVLAPLGEMSVQGNRIFVLIQWFCPKAELTMQISPVEASVSKPYISLSPAAE